MKILDPGHAYELIDLDWDGDPRTYDPPTLWFVKRNDPPDKYPGNEDSYSGTIMQDVHRCLINRLQYVQRQKPSIFTWSCIWLNRFIIELLELRVMFKKKLFVFPIFHIEKMPFCSTCGHIVCKNWHECR